MIRVLIVDDQQIVREGLKIIMSLRPEEIEVAGEAANGRELLSLLGRLTCDIVLMDIRMPECDGLEALGLIKAQYPEVRVIMLTTFENDDFLYEAISNGADGYLLKDASADDILKTVLMAHGGNMILNQQAAAKMFKRLMKEETAADQSPAPVKDDRRLNCLSRREREVFDLLMSGCRNKEISERLYISEGTVKNHVSKILEKLGVPTRSQLILSMTKVMDR